MGNRDQDLSDSTSVTALVIALFALVVALAQLLQQYFNTAEGYRRCQSPIIGQWSQRTRRKFRWQQLRFEVMFSTPTITVVPIFTSSGDKDNSAVAEAASLVHIDDTDLSRQLTYTPKSLTKSRNPDIVGWTTLLDELHELQRSCFARDVPLGTLVYQGCSQAKETVPLGAAYPNTTLSGPAIEIVERSWDLMPPEMIRPVAYSTVSDIIILAHRLGLGWRELRPGREMYAEGSGQSMLASMVRGYGMVMHYTRDRNPQSSKRDNHGCRDMCIPSEAADKMGFGILAGDRELGLEDLNMISGDADPLESIDVAMTFIGVRNDARTLIMSRWKRNKTLIGFSEIIALWCPFLPLKGSTVRTIMRPLPHIGPGLIWREGRAAFRTILRSTEKANSVALNELLERCTEGNRRFGNYWVNFGDPPYERNQVSCGFINWLRDQHHWATQRLRTLSVRPKNGFDYQMLVAAHLTRGPFCFDRAVENCRKNKTLHNIDVLGIGTPYSNEAAEYFYALVDDLPQVVDFMKKRGAEDATIVIEAWWTMMFRGIVWFLSVYILNQRPNEEGRRGIMVPSSLWGSQAPVYIA